MSGNNVTKLEWIYPNQGYLMSLNRGDNVSIATILNIGRPSKSQNS